MPLQPNIVVPLMLATFGFITPGAQKEFAAYAGGIIKGLATAQLTAICTGAGGTPGQGQIIGLINPGPIALAPLIQVAAIGVLPPIPGGTPQPLQITYFLAISQIATALLTAQITLPPAADNVAAGVGIVTPGGVIAQASAIELAIIAEYVTQGLMPTPGRLGMAKAIGIAMQQFLLLTTATVPIIGGVPAAPPVPGLGTRIGTIS